MGSIATILLGQHAHMHGKCLSKFGVDWMYALGVGANLHPQLALVMSMHVEAWWHPDEASILVIMTWIATIPQGKHAHMHGK